MIQLFILQLHIVLVSMDKRIVLKCLATCRKKMPEKTHKIKVSKTLKFWQVCIYIEREDAVMV